MNESDRYEGLKYRGMISWSSRLEREWPLYAEVFADVPERSLLDLGCGPGEHCARFATEGWRTVGVDVSASQIEDARRHHPELEFVQADLGDLGSALDGRFGAVLCVGNVLPNLDDPTLDSMFGQLARSVVPGGRLLLQQLEFGPIRSGKRRSIGPVFRPATDDEPESAFLRMFCPTDDPGLVDFLPTRMLLRPGAELPVEIERARTVRWRARSREEVEAAVLAHDFRILGVWGSPERTDHDPVSGQDLWLLAVRADD